TYNATAPGRTTEPAGAALAKPLHVQFPANLIDAFTKEERRYIAHFLRLRMRFQKGVIHPSLDKHVAKRAGMSVSNLRRVVKILSRPCGNVRALLQLRKADDLPEIGEGATPEFVCAHRYVQRHGSA